MTTEFVLVPDIRVQAMRSGAAHAARVRAGAELQAVVRRATNWALDENLDKNNLKDVGKEFHPMVERRHFDLVLEKDMKPAFGAADDALSTYHAEGIFHYGPRFEQVVQELHAAAHVSEAVPKSTILLQGARLRA